MGNAKLDFGKRYKIAERKVKEKLKGAFIDDTPPAIAAKRLGGSPTVKSINKFTQRHSFASLLPYESYDKETGIFFNRDTVGFVLYCIPATAISASELKVLNGIYSMQHKANTSIQTTLYGDPNIEPIMENWKNFGSLPKEHKFKPMLDMLAQNRVDFMSLGKWESLFTDEPALLKNTHLIVSYTIPVPEGMAPVDVPKDDIKFLQRTRESISGTLRSASIFSRPMEPDALITLMDGMLNPSKGPKKPLRYDENNLISSQCVDADTMALWNAGLGSIVHEEEPYSILPFHVRQFPQVWPGFKNAELMGSFTNSILRHACPFLMTSTVNVPDQVSEKSTVTKKQLRATQMATSAVAKFVPQWEDRKKDWDYASSKVDEGNKMLEAFFQVILFTPQGKEQQSEQALKGIFESVGWVLSRSRYTPLHSFLGALPMGVCQDTYRALKLFGHYHKRLSWTCTNLAPWIGEFKGTKTPLLLLAGRKGQISYFDNFDNKQGNYNIACTAASGGGKSFFTQELVQRTITNGGQVFIIDAGHSYRNLNTLLDGTYIDFGKGTPKFNPFSTIRKGDPKFIKDQIPLLKLLFEQMASPDEKLDQVYKSTLEKAIMGAWHAKDTSADVDEVIAQLLLDKDENSRITPEAVYLRKALYSYSSEGVYGDYFTGESNVDLTNNFVVLELDALNGTPDLQSVVLLILMMRITQAMYLSGNRSQRKLCIIDEAWRLLGSGNAGEFIEEGYRVARKHGGCFMTITQKVSDYYKSETAKAAFMNADFSVYLRQKDEELTSAEKLGHIDNSDGKIDILRGLKTEAGKYSELAIGSPDGLSVHRFYVDPIAAKLYSTTPADVDFILDQQEKGYTVLEAVTMLVSNESKIKGVVSV
jgi:conjugal transfer ATP-binding protein TraC